jgi:hypothetical protein
MYGNIKSSENKQVHAQRTFDLENGILEAIIL